MMKKPITVSGLVQSGAIQNNLDASLPKFNSQTDLSNAPATLISLEQIQVNPYQPRRIFPEIELQELARSIEEIGLIQPIAVRKLSDNAYQIIAGERRFRAFKSLNKNKIACVIFNANDADMAVMAIAENVNRKELSDYEIAKSIHNVEQLFPSKTSLAQSLGFQREDMYRYFAYDALPEFVIEKLENNPRLLARNAAADIKRVLNKIAAEHQDIALSILQEAMTLLEQQQIEQTKIAAFIASKTKSLIQGENLDAVKDKQQLLVNNKNMGYLSSSAKGVEVKISAGILNDKQLNELKKVLTEFLSFSE